MAKYRDIIIIGGGAAGLMAATGAGRMAGRMNEDGQRAGTSIMLLEKMPRPGRKIMITGKGRCNFTNVKDWDSFSDHIHPNANLLKPAFFNLTPEDLTEMFESAGLRTVIERGDRAFPESHRSADVVDTLARMAGEAGTDIRCGCQVVAIHMNNDRCATDKEKQGRFSVRCTDGSEYCCKCLIIATGGLSYPSSGSTGDGLVWAGELGLKISATFPSLTAIVPAGYKVADGRGHIDRSVKMSARGSVLCGVQLKNTGLTVTVDGNPAEEEFGEIYFTDGGLEGPVGFKVSRKCVQALVNGSRVSVTIDLKPAVDSDDLDRRISSLWQEIASDRRSAGRRYSERFRILLGKLLPKELVEGFILWNPGVDHKTLAKTLKNWEMEISGYVGYERCVITAGGVSAKEINARTMECRKIPGLYLAGEIIDLDADTGGYNLHTAFSTGYLAGQSAAKSL